MFHLVTCNVTILAIAVTYYAWRDGYVRRLRSHAQLNQRVAYMLWAAADRRD